MSLLPINEFMASVHTNMRHNVKTVLLGLDIGKHFVGAAVSDERVKHAKV